MSPLSRRSLLKGLAIAGAVAVLPHEAKANPLFVPANPASMADVEAAKRTHAMYWVDSNGVWENGKLISTEMVVGPTGWVYWRVNSQHFLKPPVGY